MKKAAYNILPCTEEILRTMGIYAAVLHALNNMDKDLLLVTKDDAMGRRMQDLELSVRKRAARKKSSL